MKRGGGGGGGGEVHSRRKKKKRKATSVSLYAIIGGGNDFVHDKNHARKKHLPAVTIQGDDYIKMIEFCCYKVFILTKLMANIPSVAKLNIAH